VTPSADCIAFIKGYEKCRLKAFKPTPNDNWTIGWGATGPGIREGVTWTQEQADARFELDKARFAACVDRVVGPNTTQGQYDAMVSLAYNIGETAFRQSTLAMHHKAGEHAAAALQFARWNKQAGKVLAGLTTRRRDEARMYAPDADEEA
jgi:lysozyme